MLKTKKTELATQFYESNKGLHSVENYYRGILLPLMLDGDWRRVENLTALKIPDGRIITFREDIWDISWFTQPENIKLLFTLDGKKLERNITNELKAVVLALCYTGSSEYDFVYLSQVLNRLKNIAEKMLSIGLNSFSQLTMDNLRALAQRYPELLSNPNNVGALNILLHNYDGLPFKLYFSKLTQKRLGITYTEQQQHLVIPPRIYTELMKQLPSDIKKILPYLTQLESEVKRMIEIEQKFKLYKISRLREGKVKPHVLFGRDNVIKVIQEFENQGVKLVDYFETDKQSPDLWMTVFNSIRPDMKSSLTAYARSEVWSYDAFVVGDITCKSIADFKVFLMELDTKCKTLCLLLSGMRTDELHSMHPDYGAQSYEYNGQTIHVFCTRQSKITRGTQTKEDMFVTTQTGHDAFRVLTTIHRPLLKMVENPTGYFVSLKETTYPKTLTKASWRILLSSQLNLWIDKNLSAVLTSEDIGFIRATTPSNTSQEKTGRYKFNCHQTRRSFAFYMIGFELMAFPQLKQQLSHLSSAMTRHYANNATYWGALRLEIQSESVRQKSTLLAQVYQRIANQERIAGGKAKALHKIAGGSNFFERSDNNRMLEATYWAELIKNGKQHIHAIAPGMYCTNSQCDMRINVTLEECVDCEFDIIMDGMYAEGKRVNATRNLALLEEQGELTYDIAIQLAMQIKSCEAILRDLGIAYEPVTLPKIVTDIFVESVSVHS